MIIKNNIATINAHRQLKIENTNFNKAMEKLASGMRINRAGDDPSGLAVSEKMRSQIHGLKQATRNTEDGISFIQTAEGYMQTAGSVLQRIRTLAVQAANGIYTGEDRQMIQVEVSQLIDEIDRVASQAEFNKKPILQGNFSRGSAINSMWIHMGANQNQRERIFIATLTARSLKLKDETGALVSLSTLSKANDFIRIVDNALGTLNKERANLGAYYNRLEQATNGLMIAYENTQSSESRIRDTDMAEQSVELTKNQILYQAAISMLTQANTRPQIALQLLR